MDLASAVHCDAVRLGACPASLPAHLIQPACARRTLGRPRVVQGGRSVGMCRFVDVVGISHEFLKEKKGGSVCGVSTSARLMVGGERLNVRRQNGLQM